MDKKIILSVLIVALIGIVAATYQINNGVDILNPLSNVEIEDTPVTETLEAPAEAATSLDGIVDNNGKNKEDAAKARDTEVENSEPINATSNASNTNGSDANSNNTANTTATTTSDNASQNNGSSSVSTGTTGSNIQLGLAGDDSAVVEGRNNGASSSSDGSSANSQNSPRVQPVSGNNQQSNQQQTSSQDDNDNGEISIEAARSLVEQFILEKWDGNNVTLSYGTTVINDYGDKCYIYNMINDNGVQEGQASYNLRNKTIEIMDNSGAEYL